MQSLEQAIKKIDSNVEILGTAQRAIAEAVDYTLSGDIVSAVSVLPFRNSQMDGFAIRSEWIASCSKDHPVSLSVGSVIFAGESLPETSDSDKAARIMTGAPVPDEYDTVVKFEDTVYDENQVVFKQPSPVGANIRLPGEDIEKGQKLFSSGHRLRSLDIGILASVGLQEVSVYRKPRVMMVSTGDEVMLPGETLGFGQIYNSNRSTVASMVKPFVESIETTPIIKDNPEALRKAIDGSHDIIITSGGVSAGDRDYVISAAESCGWTPIFHKARIKPGKPIFFARRGNQLLFGLPGNPLSTAVTCAVFLIPALKKIAGRQDYLLRRQPANLAQAAFRKGGRLLIWPGTIRNTDDALVAEFSEKKSSAALTALLGSDGLIFQDTWDGNMDTPPGVSVVRWQQLLDC